MQRDRRLFCQHALALGAAAVAAPAWAQNEKFPSKPIKVVVPYPAGGQTDTIARIACTNAAQTLGQPVLVDNRPGVGGQLGAEMVAKAPPDGYTLLLGLSGTMPSGSALYRKLKYDPADLRCVTEMVSSGAVWLVNASLPVNNMRELVAYAKANPDKVSVGSWGPGSFGHASQHLLDTHFGAKMLHVPYKGEAQLITDLVGGQIGLTMVSAMTAKAHLKSGKIRAVGFSGDARTAVFPDLPTVAEQGFKEPYWMMSGPTALFAPKGTPADVVAQISAAFMKAAQDPKFQEFAREAGAVVVGNSVADAQANYSRYFDVIKKVVQGTGVVID